MSRMARKERLARKAARSQGVPTTHIIVIVALASGVVLLLADRFFSPAFENGLNGGGAVTQRIEACAGADGRLRIIPPGQACAPGERPLFWFEASAASPLEAGTP